MNTIALIIMVAIVLEALVEYIKTILKMIEDGEYKTAITAFYKKLSDVAAAIGKTHVYMDIKITNSEGGCIKKDSVGAYVETE